VSKDRKKSFIEKSKKRRKKKNKKNSLITLILKLWTQKKAHKAIKLKRKRRIKSNFKVW
jgi:hypothetical protein